ncbi:MAG: cache domain-containing protein [Pseudomonadota bacterium]
MKSIVKALAAASLVIAATAACGAELGTTEEAVALVKKASAHLKSVDRKKALADFDDPNGKFVDRDLYIFVLDMKGTSLAVGSAPMRKSVGMNLFDMRDVDGKYFVRNMIEAATAKGHGWVDFKFPNFSKNNVIETKSSYVEKVDDLVIGCGAFKR